MPLSLVPQHQLRELGADELWVNTKCIGLNQMAAHILCLGAQRVLMLGNVGLHSSDLG